MKKKQDTQEYWDKYYQESKIGGIPSQFATFILNEYHTRDRFIDLGCGSGRDSFFFAAHGKKVLAADGSQIAIQSCQEKAKASGLKDISFEQLDFSSNDSCDQFAKRHGNDWAESIIYARFFLHAIDEGEERRFLELSKALLSKSGRLCVEFRTDRDELQRKVTASHYRRFINPIDFIKTLHVHSLKVDYFCEGFGMAKYQKDDAHVARFIVSRS